MRRGVMRVPLIGVLLVSYLMATLGLVPSLAWLVGQLPTDARFPCEARGCGCTNAVQCWTLCTCGTRESKLAWHLREGVPLPAVAAPTNDEWLVAMRLVAPDRTHCVACIPRVADRLARGETPFDADTTLRLAMAACGGEGCCCCQRPDGHPTPNDDRESCCAWPVVTDLAMRFASGTGCRVVDSMFAAAQLGLHGPTVVTVLTLPRAMRVRIAWPDMAPPTDRSIRPDVPPPRA